MNIYLKFDMPRKSTLCHLIPPENKTRTKPQHYLRTASQNKHASPNRSKAPAPFRMIAPMDWTLLVSNVCCAYIVSIKVPHHSVPLLSQEIRVNRFGGLVRYMSACYRKLNEGQRSTYTRTGGVPNKHVAHCPMFETSF